MLVSRATPWRASSSRSPSYRWEVRAFFKEVVSEAPEQDIGLLVAARRREGSEEGKVELGWAL